ncbi:interferon-induced protein 44-like isoform X2 [Clarias gariepinus]|uniref:interferon-induced protein 44-like isoform X2 n=1 Tax=Clarias gariepinus TaxID=13013 RepID=UPI00234D0A16|nr:interferon-induced protein 44-like isoform X2 [Clarias gariepinus]
MGGIQATPPPPPEFDRPWRMMHWGSKDVIEQKLRNFRPDNVQFVRILVVGEVGAGKSSFINSVNNAFQGRITSGALVGGIGGTSFTKAFNPASPLSSNAPGYRSSPSLEDQTFCLVNIMAADKISLMDSGVFRKLQAIREAASHLNMPQVIIMTKVDLVCPLVHHDIKKIYTSKRIKEKMQECSNILGLPMNYIFPVKNYHEEIDTEDDMDLLILKALDQIMHIAADKSCTHEN